MRFQITYFIIPARGRNVWNDKIGRTVEDVRVKLSMYFNMYLNNKMKEVNCGAREAALGYKLKCISNFFVIIITKHSSPLSFVIP